ncbi:MAG: portal protein [Candidatus Amoebophilus sp.]
MVREWKDEIAQENFKDYKDNANARRPWERDALRFEDFRYGSHFSRKEEEELLMFRQAPLPISVTTAICDTAEAMMVASKPTIKVAPIIHPYSDEKTNISKRVASTFDYLIKKSWFDSLGALQYDRVVRDYTNVGHGFFYVVPRNEYGEFTTDIKHLNWRYVYPHPLTKSPFYDDADNIIIAMQLSIKAAYKFVKAIETDLTEAQFKEDFVKGAPSPGSALPNKYSPAMKSSDVVLFVQKLTLEDQFVYIVTPKNDGINKETNELAYRVYTEKSPELIQAEKEGKVHISQQRKFVLTEHTSIGSKGYKIVYPIDTYNVVPMIYDHRDNPYPLGRVWYLYPIQRALNKFIMIAILNGSLMNANRIIAEDDSIVDIDEWRRNFSTPGAILRWRQTVPGMSKPPTVMEAKPLAEAWLAMPKYLSYIMEYISGIFGVQMGDSRDTPDVFSTVASLQSAGGNKMKRRVAQADAALSVVGRVAGQFYREYAPLNGFASNINDNGELEQPVFYNKVRTSEDGKTVDIDPITDLSLGFRDVRFTTQSSNGFEAGTEAALLTNLATQLKVPQLLPLILKRINIPDVDKIMDQISMINQQENTIQQQNAAIEKLNQKTEILANQITQMGMKVKVAEFASKMKMGALIPDESNNGNGQQVEQQNTGGME